MIKKRDRQIKAKEIESFADGGEGVNAKSPMKKGKKFKRVTFSLTEHEDQLIDELSLRVRTFRCNRSQVVKAALELLSGLDRKDLIAQLEKQKEA